MNIQNLFSLLEKERNSKNTLGNSTPVVYDLSKNKDVGKVKSLLQKKLVWKIVDDTDEQKREFYFVQNPKALNSVNRGNKKFKKLPINSGRWVYYPWSGSLVHILEPNDYKSLRTSRNKFLITEKEQKRYEKSEIAFAGLNVGNPAAVSIALEGGEAMRFADNDVLSVSNLNRFRSGIQDLGINKAMLTARQVYEINPFVEINVFASGINSGNIQKFILNPKVDIIVEEMDHLPLKLEIRKFAKRHRVPVVMVTGNGENVILDIERYDRNPKMAMLNNKLSKNVQDRIVDGEHIQSVQEFAGLCRDFIGKKYLTKRLNASFEQIGESLAAIPQLAEASFLRGAVLSNVVRRIILGENIKSGRYIIKMDQLGL
ncbi:MAG: ThiF family adenylyltransferase [Candidatus Kerfeldbacteria bacterium]|nr:ThiF family adenylyltransferase [Candidatus Kerfeldbacteria bacterium]